jgi:hypothetical protein
MMHGTMNLKFPMVLTMMPHHPRSIKLSAMVLLEEQLTPYWKIVQVHLIPVMILYSIDESFLFLFRKQYFAVRRT